MSRILCYVTRHRWSNGMLPERLFKLLHCERCKTLRWIEP